MSSGLIMLKIFVRAVAAHTAIQNYDKLVKTNEINSHNIMQ